MLIEISGGRTVEITAEIADLIRAGAPVGVGVSGGKDSAAVALATREVLEALGHTGPRVLIHADLGLVEWRDSLPSCRRLAAHLQWPLQVVRRAKGGMIERWVQRWEDNWERYRTLSMVKVVKPWSDARWRFCTSELKVAPIGDALSRRFENSTILSITGIRREEGAKGQMEGGRKNAPTAKPMDKLRSVARKTTGWTWNPIAHWTETDVYAYLGENGVQLHEGYTKFKARRISCVICIFSQVEDMQAALRDPHNHGAYRAMCELELTSTFSFQADRWLSDLRPELLSAELQAMIPVAKERATRRHQAEALIPAHMEYKATGHTSWPTHVPTLEDAERLGRVRASVAESIGRPVLCTDPHEIIERYTTLLAEARRRGAVAQPVMAQGQLF